MKQNTVYRIREFNRFYLPALGLLGNHYLGSAYSPTEARVLYEIHHHDGCTAAQIARDMNIDKSYLSRILHHHEKNGYLFRQRSQTDSRAYHLHLTDLGRSLTEDLTEKSNLEIGEIIAPLSDGECQQLTEALAVITDILVHCHKEESP